MIPALTATPTTALLTWTVAGVVAYFCGSIPFGLLLGRLRGVDIREHGSRNIGATNVGRVLGRRLGILCFFLDALKGAVPVTVAGVVMGVWGQPATAIGAGALVGWLFVAIAALAGHMASPWLRFRGGKGVATGFGALLAVWPILTVPALIAFACWVIVLLATRYVSLASVVAACALPIATLAYAAIGAESIAVALAAIMPATVLTALLAGVVVIKHRGNIARLHAGTEPKIGSTKTK